ncbi:hypothetical protein [Streptomyces sp. DSM 15324]|uniref:hypothetical protein n=1 Tax=Streptomyces sp. DSM 15324 TaxID=1739111 RepID=UPI0007486BA2|nr:hypothetical protein [Streptomyces sp. DSM 15324]KUO09750.1 hypothetical protein AQJ58_23640 [Streptomyces sp. DSM 15324]
MSDTTPSQAEGERPEEEPRHRDVPRTTPSQAEGETVPDEETETESEQATVNEQAADGTE